MRRTYNMFIKDFVLLLVNLLFSLIGGFLALRFILKLFGANAENGFVSWIYEMTDVLLEPFRGIFEARVFENTYVFEFSTLFALLIYGLFALLAVYIVGLISAPAEKKKK
jgi:uncharacterized protein YggT (Ycf19 family)